MNFTSNNTITYPNNVFGIVFPPTAKLFGSFSLNQTRTVSAANTPTVIPYDTIEASRGITYTNTSRIVAPTKGYYEFNWSIQLDKSGGGISPCDIWLRKNGQDLPRSGGQVVVAANNGETLPFVNYFLELDAGDYVQVVFASSDATMAATNFPAWSTPTNPYTRPSIPAIITTIKYLGS
jgi:hypothetical protein